MKAKLLISSLLLGTVILALAKEDPVLMTINGKDIKLSEFEYLYNKNNQQQVEKETLDQYLDRFVLYKQKVADAEAAGLDTTRSFKSEFEGYQKDLATPYMMKDSTYEKEMLNEAYTRLQTEVNTPRPTPIWPAWTACAPASSTVRVGKRWPTSIPATPLRLVTMATMAL